MAFGSHRRRRRRRRERRLARHLSATLDHVHRLERIASWRAREELLQRPEYREGRRLAAWGYRVHSQGDEDGILAEIFRRVGSTTRTFVEIGAGDGLENNTACLLLQGWRGAWVEADPESVRRIRETFAEPIESGRLRVASTPVDRANAAGLLAELAPEAGLDLLSVDIDGNDYHVLASLEPLPARVVVAEYNAKFPPPHEWVMRYDSEHRWDESESYGASLAALEALLRRKGFALVGCSLTGVNAFFVRSELAAEHFPGPCTAEHHYEPSRDWLIPGLRTGHAPGFAESAPLEPGEARGRG